MVLTRRGLFTGAAGFAVKPKKKRGSRVGMQPDQQGVFFQLIIQGGGEFTYDAAGNLRTANVGQTTTDPIQGITCYAGFSTFNGHGAVISLFSSTLDAQFWYADTGTSAQGALTSSVASAAGTDPFGNAFKIALGSYQSQTFAEMGNGALILLGSSNPASLATSAANLAFVQDALVAGAQPVMQVEPPLTAGSPTPSIWMKGASNDSTVPGQILIANAITSRTTAVLETQGAIAFGGTTAATIATASTDTTGYPGFTDPATLALNFSGCQPASGNKNTVTGTTFANLAFGQIPANDAEANAVYELEMGGYGVQGSTGQNLTLQARFGASPGADTDVVGVAALLSTAGFITINDGFQWSAKVRAECLTSGVSATWRIYVTGTITDTTASPITASTTLSFAVGTGNTDVTQDSTAIIKMGLSAKWASTTGAPTITKSGSQFGRRG